jgi:hypothetical protein
MTRYAKLILWLIGVWFVLAVTLSALHVIQTEPGRPPLALGLAAGIPIVVFLVGFSVSTGLREFLLSLNPRILTAIQSWRLVGFVFLVLAAYGILPKVFALPAGWGDIAIGATAPLAAAILAKAEHRRSFLAWQALGMLDLVMAVALGALAGTLNPQGIVTSPMTVLPLSLIPTFAVPLLLMLHIICVAQARRWPARAVRSNGAPLAAPVV